MDKNKFWFWNYIISFIKEQDIDFEVDFSDIGTKQLRSLFTSYCLVFNIDAGTAECDACLWDIFDHLNFDETLEEKFNNFMLEFLE